MIHMIELNEEELRKGLKFSDWKMYDADNDFICIVEDQPTEADAIEESNNPYGGKDGMVADAVRGERIKENK